MSKALKAAIEANDPDAVRQAAKTVKDINRKLPGARTPLLYACEKGADKVLQPLFDAGAIAEGPHPHPDDTPVAIAGAHGQFAVIKQLLVLKKASEFSVRTTLESASANGRVELVEFLLKEAKPPVTMTLFRLASVPQNAPVIVRLLAENGAGMNVRSDKYEAKAMTPLHELATDGKAEVIQTLVDCGADVNARDSLGRTPLMTLAANWQSLEMNNNSSRALDRPERVVDPIAALQALLDAGADASLVDYHGNDAIDHCSFEYVRSSEEPPQKVVELLRRAGAKGSDSNLALFRALRKDDVQGVRTAIANGADINRLMPPPTRTTPLVMAACGGKPEDLEIALILLNSGADPNKSFDGDSPLIQASRNGNLELVKELIKCGANVHAVYVSGERIENAYSAAGSHENVRAYLKSLGARNPTLAENAHLKPGVQSWNNFSEVLVKSTVSHAADSLAKMINGKVQSDVYGQSFQPGKQAYLVIRTNGMDWCNVFQIAPPRDRFEDSDKTEAFAVKFAKACNAPVLSIEFSDTSVAASVLRVEPSGKKSRDLGWDHDSLEEIVESLGDEAPAWAKKQLAKTKPEEPSSTERLEHLAQQEKFAVAAFGFYCEPGEKLDVEITGFGPEAFDGVAFVSS